MATTSPTIKTLADLVERLGGVSLDRIRFRPRPATVQDLIDVRECEGALCELVEGVLVEKPPGFIESVLTAYLAGELHRFVRSRNLGIVTGPDGAMELAPGLVRIPDVAFTSWDRLPGRRCPTAPVPHLAPKLAAEVLSRSSTSGEMAVKRREYFAAGVHLVWELDPDTRTATVYSTRHAPRDGNHHAERDEYYSGSDRAITLSAGDVLDGGSVLPGFSLAVTDLFGELDRHG